MHIIAETNRLLLRELELRDADSLFEMDSNRQVLTHAGAAMTGIEQSRKRIESIRTQYREYGSGRFAVVESKTDEFVGCCGIRFIEGPRNGHTKFYSLGYRFIPRYWGKGYATEAAAASLKYGFGVLDLQKVFAMADIGNIASRRVLEKIGMKQYGTFMNEGHEAVWLELTKNEWLRTNDI